MKTSERQEDENRIQLVRIKRAAQITLPPELRKQFGLVEGDYLEITSTKDGILLKPVSVVARKTKSQRVGNQAVQKKAAG
jgi:AbrB family looped-hinge helix DNA binding protein